MKARELERLAFGLMATAAIIGFEVWSGVDLWFSGLFHAGQGRFPGDELAWVRAIYVAVPWVGRALFAVALGWSLLAWWQPRRVSRRAWRRAVALTLSMLLGLGAVVHGALKEHWGRPRPDQVAAFGGPHEFVQALHRSTICPRNCSFVSGHAATGFALIGLGAFAAPHRRRRWLSLGIASGAAIGLLRIAQGRHFASDIVFALLVMWGTALLLRELWLRVVLLRRRRLAWRPAPPLASPT